MASKDIANGAMHNRKSEAYCVPVDKYKVGLLAGR